MTCLFLCYRVWAQNFTVYENYLKKIFFLLVHSREKKVKVKVAQSCPALCDPMDCRPPGSSVHGILQARILQWVAIPFSKGSFQPGSPALQADSLPSEPPGKPSSRITILLISGLSKWRSGKESACQFRRHKRHGFSPWVGKIPWSRKWQLAPIFFPGEFHGQRTWKVTVHGVTKNQTRLSTASWFLPPLNSWSCVNSI